MTQVTQALAFTPNQTRFFAPFPRKFYGARECPHGIELSVVEGKQMIDVTSEVPLTLVEAARSLPGRPHIATLHRWRLRGVRGVRLQSILIGGRRFTTREALERFFAETTAAACGEPPPARTSKQRRREIEAAERELAEAGI